MRMKQSDWLIKLSQRAVFLHPARCEMQPARCEIKTSGTVFLIRTSQPVNNIYIYIYIFIKFKTVQMFKFGSVFLDV